MSPAAEWRHCAQRAPGSRSGSGGSKETAGRRAVTELAKKSRFMQIKIFTVPVVGGEAIQEDLNKDRFP
jgi:tripartite-type tricarboxylate transporter receptor subunit TctC